MGIVELRRVVFDCLRSEKIDLDPYRYLPRVGTIDLLLKGSYTIPFGPWRARYDRGAKRFTCLFPDRAGTKFGSNIIVLDVDRFGNEVLPV